MRRGLTILGSTLATILLVLAFLFVPLSIVTGEYGHVVIEIVLMVLSLWYVTRVMRRKRSFRRIGGRSAARRASPSPSRCARRSSRWRSGSG